jgi:hypothetical protein
MGIGQVPKKPGEKNPVTIYKTDMIKQAELKIGILSKQIKMSLLILNHISCFHPQVK